MRGYLLRCWFQLNKHWDLTSENSIISNANQFDIGCTTVKTKQNTKSLKNILPEKMNHHIAQNHHGSHLYDTVLLVDQLQLYPHGVAFDHPWMPSSCSASVHVCDSLLLSLAHIPTWNNKEIGRCSNSMSCTQIQIFYCWDFINQFLVELYKFNINMKYWW